MRKFLERALDWSLGSVVGNLVWIGLTGLCAWVFNERTGLLATIIEFAGEHAQEFAAWTASAALVGAVAGLLIRHRIALGQLAKKNIEISSLETELAGRPMQADLNERNTRIASLEEELRSVNSIVNLKEERIQSMRDTLITRLGSEEALTRKDVEEIVSKIAKPLQWQEIEGPDDTEDGISSFERTLSILNNREKWCLRQVIDVEETNRTFSTSAGGFLKPTYENLAGLGILTNLGDREIRGEAATAYTISPEWRTWLSGHDGIFAGVTMEDAGLG